MTPYERWQLPLAEHEPFQLDGTLKYLTFAGAEAAYSFWKDAVWNFSRRALTFQTDRLPAISAVASTIAGAVTGDRYLAGLWRNELLAGLCWTLYGRPKDDVPRPDQEYIAPTWSWASHPGMLFLPQFTSCDTDNQATVLEAWTALKGPDPYGAVSDGAIVLFGVHCDVEMTTPERDDDGIQLDFGHGEVQTVNYPTRRRTPQGALPTLFELDGMQVEPDTDVDRLSGNPRYLRRVTDRQTDGQPACSGTVHLLWLMKEKCLILTPSRRKGKEEAYERLGGIFIDIMTPEMPKKVQPSSIKLV